MRRTVYNGRSPNLELLRGDSSVALRDWGTSLVTAMASVAKRLDEAHQSADYSAALKTMQQRLANEQTTPSAMLLKEMTENNETYYAMAMRKACEQREHFRNQRPSAETMAKYQQLAVESQQRQATIEADDHMSFDEFLANY